MSKQDAELDVYPVSLTCKDLQYNASRGVCSKQVEILRGISILAEPGEMIAIIGPSGCGKTTMLNCLCQRNKISTMEKSKVLYNGQSLPHYEARRFINYVLAKDRLLPYLTVEETLQFGVRLRAMALTRAEQQERVDYAIDAMRLNLVRNTYVGGEWKKGISSGELKRLSIAMELLDNPSVLLLDEPTSGLDSNLALEVVVSLRDIANQNRTVICSIHQPRSQVFQMFDKVMLISNGRVLYFGTPMGSKEYFGNLGYQCPSDFNPADYLIEIASGDGGAQLDDICAVVESSETCLGSRTNIASEAQRDSQCSDLSVDVTISVKSIREAHASVRLTEQELEALADTYQASPTAAEWDNKISAVESAKSDLPQLKPSWLRTCSDPRTYSSWFVEFGTLWKRSATNSARNPIVFCVMLLVMVITGLILGGIFWQLPAPIDGYGTIPTPNPEFRENAWFRWFAYGVDGNGSQPMLDAVEFGIDGQRTYAVRSAVPDTSGALHDFVQCAYEKYVYGAAVPSFYPPNEFPIPDEWPQSANSMSNNLRLLLDGISMDDLDAASQLESTTPEPMHPNEIIGDLVSTLQIIDWMWFNTDYTVPKKCLDLNNALRFYTCVQADWAELLDPALTCGGLPAIADVFGTPLSRRLGAVESVNNVVVNTLTEANASGGGRLIYDATVQIGGRLLDVCGEPCTGISGILSGTAQYGGEILDTILVVINIAGGLFFLVATLGFASYEALLTFPQERAIFNHESANGMYRASSYYLAKNMADLFFQLLPSLSMVTVYYWMVGLNPSAMAFFGCFIIAAATSFSAYGFGYMISALSPRMEVSVCIAPMVLVIFLVLCGFFLRDEDIPNWIGWLRYFSIYRWGFFGFVTNQWPLGGTFGSLPNEVIQGLCGVTEPRLWVNVGLLFALGFFYRTIGFLGLKYTNRKAGIDV